MARLDAERLEGSGKNVAEALELAVTDACALEQQRGMGRMRPRGVGEVVDESTVGIRLERGGNAVVVVREPGRGEQTQSGIRNLEFAIRVILEFETVVVSRYEFQIPNS